MSVLPGMYLKACGGDHSHAGAHSNKPDEPTVMHLTNPKICAVTHLTNPKFLEPKLPVLSLRTSLLSVTRLTQDLKIIQCVRPTTLRRQYVIYLKRLARLISNSAASTPMLAPTKSPKAHFRAFVRRSSTCRRGTPIRKPVLRASGLTRDHSTLDARLRKLRHTAPLGDGHTPRSTIQRFDGQTARPAQQEPHNEQSRLRTGIGSPTDAGREVSPECPRHAPRARIKGGEGYPFPGPGGGLPPGISQGSYPRGYTFKAQPVRLSGRGPGDLFLLPCIYRETSGQK